MTRPQYPSPASPPRPRRTRRAARMTVGVSLLLAAATGVAVGAAAYSKNAAANSAAIIPASANQAALSPSAGVAEQDLARSDEEARGRGTTTDPGVVADTGGREVIEGLSVKIGRLRVGTDPSGIKATTLPVSVTNTGELTRSFDITVVALSNQGQIITSDVGTAANLRPGQSAEVHVMEIVDESFVEQLSGASFRVEDAFAY